MSGGMERASQSIPSDAQLQCFTSCYECANPDNCRRHNANDRAKPTQGNVPATASEHLDAVRAIIAARGEERDLADGERSMARAVAIFNACTGMNLSESDGWLFMMCLKMSRQRAGRFKLDDHHDLIGYAALQTECVVAASAKNP